MSTLLLSTTRLCPRGKELIRQLINLGFSLGHVFLEGGECYRGRNLNFTSSLALPSPMWEALMCKLYLSAQQRGWISLQS